MSAGSTLFFSARKRCIIRRWLLLSFLMCGFLVAVAQKKTTQLVDVQFSDNTVTEALKKLESAAGTTIYYQPSELRSVNHKINGSYKQKSVAQVLDMLLSKTAFEWVELNNKIVIKRIEKKKITESLHVPEAAKDAFPAFISGRVVDEQGNPIPGVTVSIKGAGKATITMAEGSFRLEVKEKGAVLLFSHVGYDAYEYKVVNLQNADVQLTTRKVAMTGVTVSARRKLNTDASLLQERKNAAAISDGISAQQMERTASITTAQALQRVSGVTITDDKYVAVRGLGDRSVIGQLNGIRLSSSDPDRSTVPLDLVPAALLDNVVVFKTVTPDKPADASGGIIELKTKSIPDAATLSVTAQTGFNSNVGLGGSVNSFYNSKMGFLGDKVKDHRLNPDFLALAQQYPGGLEQLQQKIGSGSAAAGTLDEVNRINKLMHGLDPVLTTRYKKAALNGIYSVSYGNSFNVFKEHKLGLILSGSYYSRTTDVYNGTLNQYSIYQGVITGNPYIDQARYIPAYITPNSPGLGKYLGYKENTGTESLNYGLLAGLSYRFNKRNEISFQYLNNHGAETQASSFAGSYGYTAGLNGPVYSNIYSLKQTYRTFNTYNLQGEHQLFEGANSPKLSYNMASSRSTQEDPDYRFVNLADYRPAGGSYYKLENTPATEPTVFLPVTDHYALVSGYVNGYGPYGKIQADPNGRRFRNLDETNYNFKGDLTFPFSIKGLAQSLKVGGNYLYRERNFGEYVLSLPGSNFSARKQYPLYQVNGNLDQLVGYNQIGIHLPGTSTPEGAPGVSGFLYNQLKSPNNYNGYYETKAFYAMLDLHPLKDLRLTGGVRFESTDIKSRVDTSGVYIDPSLSEAGVPLVYIVPVSKYSTGYKPYYSFNASYSLHDKMNFRLAYSTTLARPEIRELTNVFEFDPFQQALVVGNPHLVNQNTRSYDFRWEWFPEPGEVFAASFFTKEIRNQLEKVFILNSQGVGALFPEFPTVEYRNNPNVGHVTGIELELVKSLGRLWDPLKGFFLGTNLMVAQSSVRKNAERLEASRIIDRNAPEKSPLAEQAPYSINAFLNYTNQRWGTDLTATFNMIGERLIQINMDGAPDLYSRPMPVLDFVFSQQLTKRIVMKGYAKNILNHPYEETYSNPGTGGKYYGKTYIRRSYKRGTEYMLGFTYKIF